MGIYDRDYMRAPVAQRTYTSSTMARGRSSLAAGGLGLATRGGSDFSYEYGELPGWGAFLAFAVMGQLLAFLVPTFDYDAFQGWTVNWVPTGGLPIDWRDLSTWVLLLPGAGLAALLVTAALRRLRGIALVVVAALPILAVASGRQESAAVELIATSAGLPGAHAGFIAYCGLAFAVAAMGSARAAAWVRLLLFFVGAAFLYALTTRPEILRIPLALGDFLAPLKNALEAQTFDLGIHSAWFVQSASGETSAVTVSSGAVQSAGKWLQVIGCGALLFGFVAGPALAWIGLLAPGAARMAALPLASAGLGVAMVVLGGFFWTWALPGTSALLCAAAVINHAMAVLLLASLGVLPAVAASAFLSPRR